MLYFTKEKCDCTGCGACASVCPVHCITMKKDSEGFLYPIASDACVHCGKCQRVCPIESNRLLDNDESIEQSAFCAVTRNKAVWKRSASGGAFSELCRAFANQDTIICGAAWDGLRVHHQCVEGIDKISVLCKSKYVASDTENVFSEIKKYIENGKKVIFCGTPCQVSGLRKAIGKKADNLLCIDLICHGVGSPDVFTACMEQLGRQLGGEVTAYEFRAKRSAYETDHIQSTDLSNGKKIYLYNDPYIQLFLDQLCLRPSCGKHCKFRCEQRTGDITIADFKGLTSVYPFLKGAKRNYSSIIFNTKKGLELLPILQKNMIMYPCKIEDIKKYNPLFYRQTWFSEIRDDFFAEFSQDSTKAIISHTKPVQLLHTSWKKRVWMALPQFARKIVLTAFMRGGVMSEFETCSVSRVTLQIIDGGK